MLSLLVVLPLSLVALTSLSIVFYRTTTSMQAQINHLQNQMATLQVSGADPAGDSASQAAFGKTADYEASPNQRNKSLAVSFDLAPALISPTLVDPDQDLMGRPALAVAPDNVFVQPKLAYLTFDDGPTKRTLEILDILDQYKAKATFFVTNQALEQNPDICLEAYRRGHAIGMHSATHRYDIIYQSVDSFLLDIEQNFLKIKSITGAEPTVLRFPGGSVNSYNSKLAADLIAAVEARGFKYFDWNSSSGDALAKSVNTTELLNNVLQSNHDEDPLVILFHDSQSKTSTVKGLAAVIEALQAQGYAFAALNADSEPVHFKNVPAAQADLEDAAPSVAPKTTKPETIKPETSQPNGPLPAQEPAPAGESPASSQPAPGQNQPAPLRPDSPVIPGPPAESALPVTPAGSTTSAASTAPAGRDTPAALAPAASPPTVA